MAGEVYGGKIIIFVVSIVQILFTESAGLSGGGVKIRIILAKNSHEQISC